MFYCNIEDLVRSLDGLGVNSQEYGALLAPVSKEWLPHQLKLITGKNIKDKISDLTKILVQHATSNMSCSLLLLEILNVNIQS